MAIAAHPTFVTTDQNFGLGDCHEHSDGNSYVYVQASGAISQYDYVCIDEDYQAAAGTKASVDDGHQIGFAQVAFADNEYGWVATKGRVEVNALASLALDTALYTSGTAGKLDDDTTSQTKIDGVVAVESNGTATGNVTMIATFPRSATF